MAAQRRRLVFVPEQLAPAQFRHDVVDEVAQAGREDVEHDVEAVGSTATEPGLHRIGDLLGSTGENAMSAAAAIDDLPHGQRGVARQRDRRVGETLRPLRLEGIAEQPRRDRLVEIEVMPVDAEAAGEALQGRLVAENGV